MLDPQNPAGATLQQMGQVVTGEIESACRIGGTYRPEELRSLPSPARELFQKFVADLWYWRCVEQWGGAPADPVAAPGAVQALERLGCLRQGYANSAIRFGAECGQRIRL